MRFPSIQVVAAELRRINAMVDEECDVRLQVYESEMGEWAIRWGDPSFDHDHRGYWGAACVPGGKKRFPSEDIARDLLDQAKDMRGSELTE
jgi:hypothetical protein